MLGPSILRPVRRFAIPLGIAVLGLVSFFTVRHFEAADYGPLLVGSTHKALVAISGRVSQIPDGDVLDNKAYAAPGLFSYATFVHNWHPPNLANDAVIYATSNDDPGTTITGIDATGLMVGDTTREGATVKVCNLAGVADAFALTLKNLDTRSLAGNQILTPGAGDGSRCSVSNSTFCVVSTDCPGGETCQAIDADYTISSNTCATLILRKAWLARGDVTHYAWTIPNAPTRFNHLTAINFQVYPGLLTNTVTGTVDSYHPACDGTADCSTGNSYTCANANAAGTGSAACGLSGGTLDGTDYTSIHVQTNSAGARLAGLYYAKQHTSISAIGGVKFLVNIGPGTLTLANHASATATDNFELGGGGALADMVLQPNEGVILTRFNADTGGWYALSRSHYYFSGKTVTATAGMEMTGTDASQPLGASWLTNVFANDTHSSFVVGTATNFPQLYARASGSYNTTANAITSYGVASVANATRVAGANGVTNMAGYFSAQLGDTNIALETDAGDVILNNAGNGVLDVRATSFILRQHIRTVSAAPTLTSCGTSPNITGSDMAGVIVTGTGGTTCTITFAATFLTEPPCILVPMGSATLPIYTVSATAITATTTLAGQKYHYTCIGTS